MSELNYGYQNVNLGRGLKCRLESVSPLKALRREKNITAQGASANAINLDACIDMQTEAEGQHVVRRACHRSKRGGEPNISLGKVLVPTPKSPNSGVLWTQTEAKGQNIVGRSYNNLKPDVEQKYYRARPKCQHSHVRIWVRAWTCRPKRRVETSLRECIIA